MAVRELVSLNESTPQLEAPQAGDTATLPITLTGSSGVELALNIPLVVNQSGTAGYNAVHINVTETALGSGEAIPFKVVVGGASKFSVDNAGDITFGAGTTILSASGAGKFLIDATTGLAGGLWTISSTAAFGWGTPLNPSTRLYSDATSVISQRNGPAAQESRVYGDYASSTDYQRNAIVTSRTATTVPSGASFTLSSFIPDGAFLIGITTRVDTTCTTATGYTVGDGVDADLWGVVSAVSVGTASGSADFTAAGASGTLYLSANDVVITSTGGNFDGTGVITVCAHYMITEAD